jgi:hypothetical protein
MKVLKALFAVFAILAHIISLIVGAIQMMVYFYRILDSEPVTRIPWELAIFIIVTGFAAYLTMGKEKVGETWKDPFAMIIVNVLGAIYFAFSKDNAILPFITISISYIIVKLFEGYFVYNAFSKKEKA